MRKGSLYAFEYYFCAVQTHLVTLKDLTLFSQKSQLLNVQTRKRYIYLRLSANEPVI